jgi:hypothetical protein
MLEGACGHGETVAMFEAAVAPAMMTADAAILEEKRMMIKA